MECSYALHSQSCLRTDFRKSCIPVTTPRYNTHIDGHRDIIPYTRTEAEILINSWGRVRVGQKINSYTSCAFRRVRSPSYSLIKRSPTADTIRSRAADSASFHQGCEVKSRSCVLLPRQQHTNSKESCLWTCKLQVLFARK